MKQCTKCNKILNDNCFSKNKNFKDGLQYCCKSCVSVYKKSDKYREYERLLRKTEKYKEKRKQRERTDKYKDARARYRNLESTKEAKRKYFNSERAKASRDSQEYKEYCREWAKGDVRRAWLKKYRKTDVFKCIIKKYQRSDKGKKNIRERFKKRYYSDKFFRISHVISSAIKQSLKSKKNGRHWENIVGYTTEKLVRHLEKQFDNEMSWENYGTYWHIDHIKPISLFNYDSYKDRDFLECWSLENLQPMEKILNIKKSNKYPYYA